MNIQKIKIEELKHADYNPRKALQPSDEKEYEKIECVLYESHDGVDTKIDSYSVKAKSNLEDFLQDLTFRVDDHSYTCKSFDDASVFLQINAIDKDNNVISYKIPLKLDKTCNLE